MRDEVSAFEIEAEDRRRVSRFWRKLETSRQTPTLTLAETLAAIRGLPKQQKKARAVWHFPGRKRYFRINQEWPNCWSYDS